MVTAPGSFLVIFLHYQYTPLNVTKVTLLPSKLTVIKAFLKLIVQLTDIGETESGIIRKRAEVAVFFVLPLALTMAD